MGTISGWTQKRALEPWLALLSRPGFLPICFGIFVATRAALIFWVPIAEPFSDSGWYLNRALTLLADGSYSERGLPTAYWPVGYPAFLALVFKVAGPSWLAAQLANLVLAGASFWLLYAVARRFLQHELAGRGAVLLLTLYPNNAAYVPALLTEALYTFLLLAACYGLLSGRTWWHLLSAGVLFGLATLVKTQTILLIPVLAGLAFLDTWSISKAVRAAMSAAAVLGIALLVAAPWALRNYAVLGAAVLSTNGGTALLAGNNPSVVGDYWHDYSEDDPLFSEARFSAQDQVQADKRARTLAVGWIKDHPVQFLLLAPKKVFRLWAPDGEGEWMYQDTPFYQRHSTVFRLVRVFNQAFYGLAMMLFALSIWRLLTLRSAPTMYFGLGVVLVTTFTSVVFSGQSRYHFPAMPFIFAYVAWYLATCAQSPRDPPISVPDRL